MNVFRHPAELIEVDNPVAAAVFEALYDFDPIRSTNARIDVQVSNGDVELIGNVPSRAVKQVATQLARSVSGGRTVRNRLVADTDIDIQVASTLALDPRTHLTSREVVSHTVNGVVYLDGRAPSGEAKAGLEDVIREIAGVQDVTNHVGIVPGMALPRAVPLPVQAAPAVEAAPGVPAETAEAPAAGEGAVRMSGKGKKAPPPLSPERRAMLEEMRKQQAAGSAPAPAASGTPPASPEAAPAAQPGPEAAPAAQPGGPVSGKGKKTPPPLSPERRAMLEEMKKQQAASAGAPAPAAAEIAVPAAATPAPTPPAPAETPAPSESAPAGEGTVRLSGKGKKAPPPLSPERRAMLEELKRKQQEGG